MHKVQSLLHFGVWLAAFSFYAKQSNLFSSSPLFHIVTRFFSSLHHPSNTMDIQIVVKLDNLSFLNACSIDRFDQSSFFSSVVATYYILTSHYKMHLITKMLILLIFFLSSIAIEFDRNVCILIYCGFTVNCVAQVDLSFDSFSEHEQ